MSHSTDDSFSPRSRDELLELVYRRGDRIRRRAALVRGVAITATVVFVAGVAGITLGDDPVDTVRAADRPTGEPDGPGPASPRSDDGDSEPGDDDTPAASTTTSTSTSSTTTTALVCRNSSNPDCGPFYWDPEPDPNQPVVVEITSVHDTDGNEYLDGDVARVPPDVELIFEIHAHDPDGPSLPDQCNVLPDFHDAHGQSSGEQYCDVQSLCIARHGPWTPPEKEYDETDRAFGWTYAETGEYRFDVTTHPATCGNPYTGPGEETITVVVEDPEPDEDPGPLPL